MKYFSIILLFLFASQSVQAQTDTVFRKARILKGDFVEIAVDNLDNLYTVNSRNQLKKYNANGDSVAVYNDVKQFGKASLIDVSNPLKILLYYRDYATVVTLDRFLNPVHVLDLRNKQILQAKVIGQSYDNKIWVFDEGESKLKKVDDNGLVLQETPDFRQLLGKAISPLRIFDENRHVYIYDSTHGIYVFDYYGSFRHNIMIQGWQNLSITGKFIYGSGRDTLYRYGINTYRVDEWRMPEEIIRSRAFRFSSSRLYALIKNEKEDSSYIMIYSIL